MLSGKYFVLFLQENASIRIWFPDDNFNKHLWIFTKLGVYIDIVEVWLGIANGQISSIFIPCHTIVAGYYGFTLVVRDSVRPSYVHPFFFSGL